MGLAAAAFQVERFKQVLGEVQKVDLPGVPRGLDDIDSVAADQIAKNKAEATS